MKTIIKEKRMDPQAIHESLQKGYGIEHPERISGYAGFFFNLGDVVVSDSVAQRMSLVPAFHDFVYSCIRDFQQDKYGYVSMFDYDENVELKWLAGGGSLFARYAYGRIGEENGVPTPEEYIKVRIYQDNTYILFDSEYDWLIKEHWEETHAS
jgi:hypothetical protein